MQNTKQKIISTTVELFNQHGFANVSLPHIAKKLGISLGNLTYHFPKKDQLIMSIFDTFVSDLEAITNGYQFASFKDLDVQLHLFYQFQEAYLFFYLDLLELERSYPELATSYQVHIQQQIHGLHQYFLLNERLGLLRSMEDPKVYQQLAIQYWQTVVFWRAQIAVRGAISTEEEMVQSTWFLLLPYLTEEGTKELTSISEFEGVR